MVLLCVMFFVKCLQLRQKVYKIILVYKGHKVEPQAYLNQQVASGKDIVFGENHASIVSTLGMIEETIRQNPAGVQAASVEFSPRIQPYIDQVASGTMSVEDFTRVSRITNEQEYTEIAGTLHAEGRISDDQFDTIVNSADGTIDAVLSRTNNESYPPERQAIDANAYGALHSLIKTASVNNIPVIANDIGREALPLNLVGQMTVADLIDRMDDTADGDQLLGHVDLSSSQSILVHRGALHVWDLTDEQDPSLNSVGKGIDDYLEENGRDVIVVGNNETLAVLVNEVKGWENQQISLTDPSDATIIGGQLIEQPDLDIVNRGTLPLGPSSP